MYLNEQMLNRLAQDRTRELAREARRMRQQRMLTGGWRSSAANSLKALAEWLEPNVPSDRYEPSVSSHRNLVQH